MSPDVQRTGAVTWVSLQFPSLTKLVLILLSGIRENILEEENPSEEPSAARLVSSLVNTNLALTVSLGNKVPACPTLHRSLPKWRRGP